MVADRQRGLSQDSRLERAQVVRVLTTKRVDSRLSPVEAFPQDAIDERFDPFAENGARAFGVVAGEPLDQEARHQQHLEALAQTIGENAADPKAPVTPKRL